MGATAVSMLILLEIPGAALIAAVFLGQTPPLLAVPAAVLLLAGLAIVIRAGSRGTVPVVPVGQQRDGVRRGRGRRTVSRAGQ